MQATGSQVVDRKHGEQGEQGGVGDEACATIHAAAPCFSSWAIGSFHWLGNCQCRRIGPSRLKSLAHVITAPLLYSLRQTPRIRLAGCHPVREFCMAPMASRTHWQLASNVVTAGETSASRSPGRWDERHVESWEADARAWTPHGKPHVDDDDKRLRVCSARRLPFIPPVLAEPDKVRLLAGSWKGHAPLIEGRAPCLGRPSRCKSPCLAFRLRGTYRYVCTSYKRTSS